MREVNCIRQATRVIRLLYFCLLLAPARRAQYKRQSFMVRKLFVTTQRARGVKGSR